MDKITINELKNYLGTDLQMMVEKSGRIRNLKGAYETDEDLVLYDGERHCNASIWDYKPIVYPLSMLTQEIEHNGKMIVPYYFIENKYDTTNWAEFLKQLQSDHNWIGHCDWSLMLHLLECHFDVFNWIGRGLAIDKSTLNANNL